MVDGDEASVAIKAVDVFHIMTFNFKIKDVKVLLNASLVDRLWDDDDVSIDLQKKINQ